MEPGAESSDIPQRPTASPLMIAIAVITLATLLMVAVIAFSPKRSAPGTAAPLAMSTEPIDWQREGVLRQQWHDKPVLLVFTASYCPPCQYMKEHVYTDPSVAQIIGRSFIPVMIDYTQPGPTEMRLQGRYSVEYLPTIIVLDQAENEVVRSNTLNAERLQHMLTASLQHIQEHPAQRSDYRRNRFGRPGYDEGYDPSRDADRTPRGFKGSAASPADLPASTQPIEPPESSKTPKFPAPSEPSP